MSKRFLSLVLALVMVLGTFGTMAFAEGPTANDKVNKLIELGLVKGDETGDYRLADTIRRDEVAAMVVRSMDLESVANAMINVPTKFVDVKVGQWNNGYVAVAEGRGITKGVSANEFAPARSITYAEVAAMLVRVIGVPAAEELTYSWPASYIAKAHEMGILANVEIANMGEMAVREKVFEMVFNTVTKKGANLLVANTVEGIVVENYRTENIGKDEIIVHVMKDQVQKTENKYYEAGDEFQISINAELKAKGYDVETLLGKVVTISFDKAGKVVEIIVNNDYKYVEGKLAKADEKEIKLGGKYYTVNKEEAVRVRDDNKDNRLYQAYYNNKDYHYDKFVKEVTGKEYAKATVRNGKVLFVEAFNFEDIAPVAKNFDKNFVAYYDDYRDGEVRDLKVTDKAYVINYEKNEKTEKYEMTLGSNKEIKANDVMHWFTDYKGNLTVFVRAEADNKVEGVYKEANAAKAKEDADIVVVVDGEEYPALIKTNYRIPVYSTTMEDKEFLALTTDYDWNLEPFEKEEVVVLRDMFGFVQLIGTQIKDGRFYAVISDLMNYDFTLIKNDEDGLKGKGSDYSVSLRGTTFLEDGDDMIGTKEQQLAIFERKDLVLVTADEGKISVLDELTQEKTKTIETINRDVIDFGGKDWKYISKSAVFFDVVGDPVATTIKDIQNDYFYKDHPAVKGYIIENSKGLAQVIVITEGETKVDNSLSLGDIVEVTRVRMRSNQYYLTVATPDGTETTHLVKGTAARKLVADTVVEAGTIINIKFLKGEKIADEPAIREIEVIMPPFNTFEIITLSKKDIRGEREIRLVDKNGKEETRWISRDAYVFGEPKVGDVVAIREMDKYDRLDIVYVTGGKPTGTWANPDQEAADAVIEKINALPAVDALTLENKAAVEAARTAYNALTPEQKELITAPVYEKLTNAEAKIAELEVPAIVVTVTYTPDATLGDTASTATVTVTGIENANFYRITYKLSDTETDTTDLTAIADSAPADLSVSKDVVVEIYAAADDITNGVDPLHTATVTAQLAK